MNTRHRGLRTLAVTAIATATALSALALASAHEARPGTSTRTLQECQGATVDQDAPVIARASVVIKAPVHTIWDLHTDIDAWDAWSPEITPAQKKTSGPLRPGTVFDWSPQGMKVTSTVTQVDRNRCTAWAAPVNGIDGVHLFTFQKVRGGVLATTEESWAVPPPRPTYPATRRPSKPVSSTGSTDSRPPPRRLTATARTTRTSNTRRHWRYSRSGRAPAPRRAGPSQAGAPRGAEESVTVDS
ncbi:SRPBCC family protein [Streptomyces sp. ME02-6987-2C]|uniref:SRPBCC family protein n=1 Tax=unclassified Streptomyces TaxID=2593676 RepID=UPI0029B64624|nr:MULTISPECIES: SRPBCC family protein [unclassified Streptomyces]MDX3371193.1 SRPBCC family protein [Streptomyces sp. ME02-6987-2C]MDX3426996.1 SRPBCC family protein [Streptomyces sp. ME02-6985-2c]